MRCVQSYLESLTFISHVGVETLNGDTVRFRLTTRGGAGTAAACACLEWPFAADRRRRQRNSALPTAPVARRVPDGSAPDPEHHQFACRILLVVPIALALVHRRLDTALCCSRWRRHRMRPTAFSPSASAGSSELGAMLDPLADKLLLATRVRAARRPGARAAVADGGGGRARRHHRARRAAAYRLCIGPVEAHPVATSASSIRCARQRSFCAVIAPSRSSPCRPAGCW